MRRTLCLLACLALSACATSYRGATTGPSAFAFRLSPEQCATLAKERRNYHATEQAALYASGAGSLVSVVALALVGSKVAPAISAGASLAAGGVSAFAQSQVGDLDGELSAGGCPR